MSKPSAVEREAVEAAKELTELGHALVESARRVVRARAAVDADVRAIPGCSPRHDGALAQHEWEAVINQVAKVIKVHPAVTPPVARHSGRLAREALDSEEQRTKLKRLRRRSPEQQAELDRLNAGRTVPAPVSSFTQT
jgi:hypothetical protein